MDLNEHGGPDSGPPIAHDFSSNANPLGAPGHVMAAIEAADRQRYPDPHYHALRACLADVLDTDPSRVLPTAGSSEAIRRLTLAAFMRGVRQVWAPQPGYGDYGAAARALGMQVQGVDGGDALLAGLSGRAGDLLVWLCEPCNPTGQSLPLAFWTALAALKEKRGASLTLVLDRAYEPLRLEGEDPVPASLAGQCWQLCSPNKALGLTGVRAGHALAPIDDGRLGDAAAMLALAPSWVLSAEGVALLRAWHQPATQAWQARSRQTLRLWRDAQQAALVRLGWQCRPSVVPFQLARPLPAAQDTAHLLRQLRARGIKLRDASSFGLPGWVRLSAQAPTSQDALLSALCEQKRAVT